MLASTDILLFLVSVAAFLLSTICGGGASLVLLPMLGQVLKRAQAPAALSIGTAFSSLSRAIFFRAHIRWRIVAWFLPLALPGVWLGASLLVHINPVYLEMLMGLFLVANMPLLLKRMPANETAKQPAGYAVLLIGATAGFVSGLTGAVGLLFNRFYLSYGMSKEAIVATRAANELLLHVGKVFIYSLFGLLSAQALRYGLIIAAAAVAAAWLAKRVLPLISGMTFRRIGFAAMVVSGMSLLADASGQLLLAHDVAFSYQLFPKGVEARMQWAQEGLFTLEFENDGEAAIEFRIRPEDVPADKQATLAALSAGADQVMVEEVFSIGGHYYEAYVFKGDEFQKHEF